MTSVLVDSDRSFVYGTFTVAVLYSVYLIWTTTFLAFDVSGNFPDAPMRSRSRAISNEIQGAIETAKDAKPKDGDYFTPGSLNMTRLEVNQRCYIDPELYQYHYKYETYRLVSAKQKLLYPLVRKSGSTNVRKHMNTYFNDTTEYADDMEPGKFLPADPSREPKYPDEIQDYFVFSITRDPISRFVSGFQETLLRWKLGKKQQGSSPVPETLKSFKEKYVKKRMNRNEVLEAMQVFVMQHENGRELANDHLKLQTTELRPPPDSPPLKLNALYEIADIDKVFDSFRAERNIEKVEKDTQYRSLSLNITKSDIDSQVLRKICQLTALDYCCLNYKLPPECEGAIQCRWVSPPKSNDTHSDGFELQIEAVSPYPVRESSKK